ncbi:hypothetical protein GDO81_018989 [Engystomops pustulosus]|uniref:Uncharacterized protein n=1 Tax=Engystomops pustulosus TaxID=76066 RepID=A0AAV6YT91_ENGPU|nr:hypothetical protein GDO81_018989 [Engystomops pustulosus]
MQEATKSTVCRMLAPTTSPWENEHKPRCNMTEASGNPTSSPVGSEAPSQSLKPYSSSHLYPMAWTRSSAQDLPSPGQKISTFMTQYQDTTWKKPETLHK